jgi:general transcription factor IIIA
LTNHVTITHLGHRPFSCPEDGCQKTFGYPHVMQRHVAQKHARTSPLPAQEAEEEQLEGDDRHTLDLLTGRHYDNTNHPLIVRGSGGTGDDSNRSRTNESLVQTQSRRRARKTRVIACPWPDAFNTGALLGPPSSTNSSSTLTPTSPSPSAIRITTTVIGSRRCAFKFSRAYDLARHLRSEHSIDIEHGIVEEWVGRGVS